MMERKKYIAYWPLLLLLTLSSLPATAAEEAAAGGDDVVAARNQQDDERYKLQDQHMQEAEEYFAKGEFEKARSIAEGVLAGLDLEVSEINSEIARNRLVRVRRRAREMRHAE